MTEVGMVIACSQEGALREWQGAVLAEGWFSAVLREPVVVPVEANTKNWASRSNMSLITDRSPNKIASEFFLEFPVADQELGAALLREGRLNLQLQYKTAGGQSFCYNVIYLCHYDNDGRVTGICGDYSAVTVPQQSILWREEIQQRVSEELFCKAFRMSPALMVISDITNGRIVEINDAALQILKLEREDAINSKTMELGLFLSEQGFYDKLMKTIEAGEGIDNEERHFIDSDGDRHIGLFSIEPVEINRRLCVLIVVSDITEMKKNEEQIQHQAYHDLLTGLPNRRAFEDRLTLVLEQARYARAQVAVVFLDLDGFKHVNDSYGHQAGDELLKHIAARLMYTVRVEDMVARMGGDEFTILLSNLTDSEYAQAVAERIREVCSQSFNIYGFSVSVTASVGVSFYPQDGMDIQTLMRNADSAMYRAKERGRNCVVFYAESVMGTT